MKQCDLINDSLSIRTYKRKWVNVFEPTSEMFDIEDIAHALSYQCRFGGHLKKYYSVANHSIYCSVRAREKNLSKRLQLTALMHDCSEAYLVDIPRPIKKLFTQYKEIENSLMTTLSQIYDFDWPLPQEIHDIDNEALQAEWNYLMIEKPNTIPILVYSQQDASNIFMNIFNHLKNEKK
jgi:uncharacterized protein